MNEIMTILDKMGAETEDALERFLDDEEMYLNANFPKPSYS